MSNEIQDLKQPNVNFQSPTKVKPLLIFGNCGTGKTSLARDLVKAGLLDAYLEADEFWRSVSGLDHPWRIDENPDIVKHRRLKNQVVGRCLLGLLGHYKVGVAGVWPGESQPILEKLQDFTVIVLSYKRLEGEPENLADLMVKRMEARGQERVDIYASGVVSSFEKNQQNLNLFALQMMQRRKLCKDPEILGHIWEGSVTLPEKMEMAQTYTEGGTERSVA